MNRLARERSPYLLQHAGNPVDWYPWGDDAFNKARAENKPIFLSIGYATCHWCHVMEHESFENEAIAALLNDRFVPVKVDREERPDVDRVYMAFVQATTGAGGWPMSVWLTPELKPFYGGTYFPPESRWGRPGFVDVLNEIIRVWSVDQAKVRASADDVTVRLAAHEITTPAAAIPPPSALDRTTEQFVQTFDREHGGFGQAPKFPRPSELLFLLRESVRTDRPELRDIVLQTLRAMAVGGMRDHLGGGFHRYSVDRAWRVPHFEKMLYDQAQLVVACLEAAQASGDAFFVAVAEDTLGYVAREMTGPHGGFYSAEDADSVPPEAAHAPGARAAEGAFYLWTHDEVTRLFGDDAPIVSGYFGVAAEGNAPVDPHEEFVGKNILYLARDVAALAADTGRPVDGLTALVARARVRMVEARAERPRPRLDDKVIAAWNGLMIAAFARMARLRRALGADGAGAAAPYLDAARAAATFLKQELWHEGSRTLWRRYRDGRAEIDGFAEDYACVVHGLLELFLADPDPAWLSWAVALQERQDELFWDAVGGGWFSTTGADPHILLRMKDTYDGAEPTASAVSASNLMTWSQLVDRSDWRDRLERTLQGFAPHVASMGRAVPMMAAVLSVHHSRPAHVVIVRAERETGATDLERALAVRFVPQAVTLALDAEQQRAVASLLPHVGAMTPAHGVSTAFVCRDFTCLPPVVAAEDLIRELGPVQRGVV